MASKRDRERSVGRRAGRNTTAAERAFKGGEGGPEPGEEMEPDATGMAAIEEEGYFQPTAMFDRGEFLGELAELDGVPATRAAVHAEPAPPAGCKLIAVAGPDLGTEWAFKKAEIHIGRGSENDLDFSDIGVSRHHARISLDGLHYVYTDLGSNNGSFVNGEKVESVQLVSGDELLVGARTLRFVELNESPHTAAAFPIREPPSEPVQGRLSEIVPSAAGADEPSIGEHEVPMPNEPRPSDGPEAVAPPPAEKKAGFGKLMGVTLGGLALVAGLGFMTYRLAMVFLEESAADRAARAKVEFLQGIELVRQRRFGDASVLFADVLVLRPEYIRAKEYLAHCTQEIERFRVLEDAKQLAAADKYAEAVLKVASITEESAYFTDASQLRQTWARVLGKVKVDEARELFGAGDLEGALQLLLEVRAEVPELSAARALIEEIEAIRNPPPSPKAPKRPTPFTVPDLMARAVALYEEDRVAAAIDAAEAAGGSDAASHMERMREVRDGVSALELAHKRKAAQDVLSLAPRLLEVDRSIAGGEGRVRQRIRGYYADALYLKGLEAQQGGDDTKAYRFLAEALKVDAGHRLAKTRMVELTRRGRELYYQGHATKETDPSATRALYQRLVEITPKDDQFHRWAAKWLAENPG